MRIRERVPAIAQRGAEVVHLEDPGRRLLLEPLARVAHINSGAPRELRRSGRTAVTQRPIQPQLVAEIDGHQVEHPQAGLEEPPYQGVRGLLPRRRGVGLGCHRVPPPNQPIPAGWERGSPVPRSSSLAAAQPSTRRARSTPFALRSIR